LSSCCILSMAVSNTYCVVYLFVCLRVVSCVWWYLTHIVMCICLFVFVLYLGYNTKTNKQIHNTICVRYRHRQDTTRRQTNKYTTQYVLDTTMHKILFCCVFVCLPLCCILCMVVSNTYCVVYLFVCLRFVSCVWWYLTHIVLCICLFVFVLIHNTICVRYHHTQDTT
jgi:hypothetical protein